MCLIAPASLDTIRLVRGHDDEVLLVLVADVDIRNLFVGKLHETAAVEIHFGQVCLGQVAAQVVLLHGLDVILVPDPDIQFGLLEFDERGILLARNRAGAEGHEIIVEADSGRITQFPAFRQFRRVVGHGLGSLRAVIQIEVEALLGILGGVERGEESQPVGIVVERKALEGCRFLTGQHFGLHPGCRIIQEYAAHVHAVFLVGLRDIGHLVAFFRDDERLHASDRVNGQRVDVHNIEIVLGLRFLRSGLLVGIRSGFLLLFDLFLRFRLRRRLVGILESHIGVQLVADAEILDEGIALDAARCQVEDTKAVFRHLIGFLLVDTGLPRFLEFRHDAEHDFLAVFRNPGARGALQVVCLAGFDIV